MTDDQHANRYLPPGTKVRFDSLVNGVTPASEYGVVVHCWLSEDLVGLYDCFVAFFGNDPPPEAQPDRKPYILRYAALSLMVLDAWPEHRSAHRDRSVTTENADNLVDVIDAGALRPSMHGVIRALFSNLTEPLEDQRRLVHAFDHEPDLSRREWAKRLWATIRALPPDEQGPLRMMVGLTQEDTILDSYGAEYYIDWARAQGLSEEQIVSAFRAAQTPG